MTLKLFLRKLGRIFSINEYFLNNSNSYNFYKSNYIKLKKENNQLKNNLNKSYSKNKSISKKNSFLQNRLAELTKQLILEKLKNDDFNNISVVIKSPNPGYNKRWGDYFFANSLKKTLSKKGFDVIIQERENWYDDVKADIVIVLRGKIEYQTNFDEINVMWNISHPEDVKDEEYEKYDIVFVASQEYAGILNDRLATRVEPLLQCTDPEVFFPKKEDDLLEDILFVGSTRLVYRTIVKDVLQTNHDVSVYGSGWEEFIDSKFIKGEFIPNDELHKNYSSCKILLNDHWDDMKKFGFISNRLFDALACGTFVISDEISAAKELFDDNIVTYNGVDDLNTKLEYYLANDDERELKAKNGKEIVLKSHTFENRVKSLIDCLKNIDFDV